MTTPAPTGRLLPFRPLAEEVPSTAPTDGTDPLALGRGLRHHRRARGLTLAALAERVGLSASALSLVENGKREPRLSVLSELASALGMPVADLLAPAPPSRRTALEVKWERVQRSAGFEALGIPRVRMGPGLPDEALEALVGMYESLQAAQEQRAATPEYARSANAELRRRMRAVDNYFPELERRAEELLRAIGYRSGPVTRAEVERLAAHVGYRLVHTGQLPSSTRTVTDLANRVVYLPQPGPGSRDGRALALQAIGHVVLGHEPPRDYAEFLAQRVEINYFAAAVLLPERTVVPQLRAAKKERDISVEDLRDAYAVSYETAAHRFTNLATQHLEVPVHFMRISADGVIYKAYENDGVRFPMDSTGAIEGARVCRFWTARQVFERSDDVSYEQYTDTRSGSYWCTALTERTAAGRFSVSVGVPYAQARWMRGRDTTARARSGCPDPSCCTQPPADLRRDWEGRVWPSARAHSHLLAVLPPGVFPGVDDTEVLQFVADHAGEAARSAQPSSEPSSRWRAE
ncbi:MAG TPA: helix-turn-helix domain-containing protein [Segeticoccus sp.]|uniref:helix-turn-helix domain-containing protein n=1 Tax=Segeticoccus sp. TaxID=2706531 RepID=UPI002D7EDE28|nr:helix-turn-helix domain-containing protein [Segeticoccus sp.]HET8601562.1 helix-turn-helix domain-containing protein [Segeticoccus sp.]